MYLTFIGVTKYYPPIRTCTKAYSHVKPDLVIGTSRYAKPITSVLEEVKDKIKGSKHTAILFGGPYSGLDELISGLKKNYRS